MSIGIPLISLLAQFAFIASAAAASGSSSGNTTKADPGTIVAGSNPLTIDVLNLLILQITIIITLARIFNIAVSYLKLPRVITEVVTGIILGSSALSKISAFKENVFPAAATKNLFLFGEVGLMFYMFLVIILLTCSYIIASKLTFL